MKPYKYRGQVITASSKVEAIKKIVAKNNRVVAKDKAHLETLIRDTIKKQGVKCDLNFIDVSKVKDMSKLFSLSNFNGDISKWDVSNVTNMSNMFEYSKFNGDISKWDVSKVKTMCSMFDGAKFNGNISKWDVHNVLDMRWMFENSKFDGDISKWNVNDKVETEAMLSSKMRTHKPSWYSKKGDSLESKRTAILDRIEDLRSRFGTGLSINVYWSSGLKASVSSSDGYSEEVEFKIDSKDDVMVRLEDGDQESLYRFVERFSEDN